MELQFSICEIFSGRMELTGTDANVVGSEWVAITRSHHQEGIVIIYFICVIQSGPTDLLEQGLELID